MKPDRRWSDSVGRRIDSVDGVKETTGNPILYFSFRGKPRRPEMPIRKRKTVRRKRLKKPSELEKGKAEISKLRSLIRRRTKELKSQIVEKEALLLEKDKELASLREVMEEKVKELESSLVEKGEEILTLRQAEERNRELETKVRQLETELGRKALVVEKTSSAGSPIITPILAWA